MNRTGRIFLVIEALLFVGVIWQIFNNKGLSILMFIGMVFLLWALNHRLGSSEHRSNRKTAFLAVGICSILVALLNSPIFWVMLVVAIIYIGMGGFSNTVWFNPIKRREMMIIETANIKKKAGKKLKRPLFVNERIGSDVYEWDDININVLMGDTIIDLGNTLLPKENSVVMIRKGLGRTRILVPLGVAIHLEHTVFYGKVIFESETYHLKNEVLKLYSEDYDDNQRKLKILTNIGVGDLEVIRV